MGAAADGAGRRWRDAGDVRETREYALRRRTFGKPIAAHEVIRHKLAEIAITIEAGRDVTYAALRRHVVGEDAVREVTIAKLATQRSRI